MKLAEISAHAFIVLGVREWDEMTRISFHLPYGWSSKADEDKRVLVNVPFEFRVMVDGCIIKHSRRDECINGVEIPSKQYFLEE